MHSLLRAAWSKTKSFNSLLFHLALFRVKIFNCSCTVSNIKLIRQFSHSVPICCIPKRIFCLSFQAGFSLFIALQYLLLPLSFIFVGQCESTLNCFSKAHYLKDSSLPSDKLIGGFVYPTRWGHHASSC